jgi:hypothetical protein
MRVCDRTGEARGLEMRIWCMIDYYNAEGVAADCYPDFCLTQEEGERVAPEFMREPRMEWAVRYEIRPI